MKLRQPTFPFLLGLLILLGIIVNITVTVTTQKQKYLTFHYWQTYPSLEKTYISSQYVNKHPKGWIPDEVVNAYAGGALIKGVDPVLIIPDTPPLGKYLIGLSALIFNNENIITLFCAIISLILLYLIGKQIFSSSLIALLPPFFLSFEPIFKNQLIYSPLYDMIQLVFLLAGFYFFNEGFLTKKKNIFFFILTSIFLGFFISTKFFITGLPIIGAYLFVLLFHKQKKKIISISLSLILTPLILFLSYFRVFAFDKNIHTFLGIQKWILLYHKSQLILPFSIWPLLLFNRWYVWFGDKPFISDGQWQITWPMITIFSLVAIILYAFHILKHNKAVEVLMLWTILYFLLFSFGQITSRYFVILIPVLYVIATYLCVSFLKKDFSLKNGRDFFKAMQKFMKKKNLSTSTILLFCVIFLAIIFTILPFLHKGFFPTLDDVHVLRIDMMTRELRSGQFPVRYVNDLGNGGGYFLFNFYFPGIYYVGAMLHMIGIPLVKATKFTFISLYFIGASGMFFLTKRYTDKITALIASILFITSSYFAFDIYTRGDLSETAGLTLIPWVFFFFLKIKQKSTLNNILFAGTLFALLIVTHMMVAYATGIILMLLFLLPPWKKQQLLPFFTAFIVSLCLSAFFWLPVAFEHTITNYSNSYFGSVSYKTNFLSLPDLLGLHQFATGFKPPLLGLGLFMGVFFAVCVLLFKKKFSTISYFSLGGFALCLFFMLPISTFLWSFFPYITLMQFPWRFLTVASVLAIFSLSLGLSFVPNKFLKIFLGIIFLLPAITLQRSYLRPITYNYIATYYAEDICSTSTWDHEFLPKWTKKCLPKPPKHKQPTYPLIQTSSKKLIVSHVQVTNNGRVIAFQTTGAGGVIISRYYFPGWTAFVDSRFTQMTPFGTYGLLHIFVPSGQHTILIKLKNTFVETIGNSISLFSILSILIYFLIMNKQKIFATVKRLV